MTDRALEAIRQLQKSRGRSQGVAIAPEDLAVQEEEKQIEDALAKKSLGSQFQQETNKQQDVNTHMEKYIAEKMAIRRGKTVKEEEQQGGPAGSAGSRAATAAAEEMFVLPEFLAVC